MIYDQPKITIKISSVNRQNLAVLLFVDHETGYLLLPKTVDFMAISCNFWGQERGDGGMFFFFSGGTANQRKQGCVAMKEMW